MNTIDGDSLRDRNRKVFGVGTGSLGTAWKAGKVNDIYKDESYYIEPDFKWLENISGDKSIIGGQNMKSRISGIGLKITKIDGEPIWGRDEKIKWSDLRGNNGWKKMSDGEIVSSNRTIHVQRVAYSDHKISGSTKSIVDLGQGVCMLKLPRGEGNVYLVAGVATLGKNLNGTKRGYRAVRWNEESKFSKEKWQICHGIKELVGKEPTLNLQWFENNGGHIRVDRTSMITLGNKSGVTVSWKRPWDEAEKVAVVLGVAVKYKNWWEEEFKTKNGNENISNRTWVNDVKEVGKLTNKGNGVISLGGKPEWEPVIDFKATASAKFTWRKA